MPGLLPSDFELKMQKDGFIDKGGKIIKGALKDCEFYLSDDGYDKNGNMRLSVGPYYNLLREYSICFTIPKDMIHTFFHTQNLLELRVLDETCKYIMDPIAKYIVAAASDFTQEIYKKENLSIFDGSAKSIETRRENAKKYYEDSYYDTPKEIYDNLQTIPESFLTSDSVFSLLSRQLFMQLSKDAKRFDTPEAVISLKEVTNQTVSNLIDILNDREDEKFYVGAKKFEEGLTKFNSQLEPEQEKIK